MHGVKQRFDKRCGFFTCRRNEAQILVWRHLLFSSWCLDREFQMWSHMVPEHSREQMSSDVILYLSYRQWIQWVSSVLFLFLFFGFCPSFFFCLLFRSMFRNVVHIEVITIFSTHHTWGLTQTGDPQPQGMYPDHRTIRTTRVSMCWSDFLQKDAKSLT